MGDDIADLPIFEVARLAIAVADAHPSVKSHAHFITQAAGGQGAVREVCDLILEGQRFEASGGRSDELALDLARRPARRAGHRLRRVHRARPARRSRAAQRRRSPATICRTPSSPRRSKMARRPAARSPSASSNERATTASRSTDVRVNYFQAPGHGMAADGAARPRAGGFAHRAIRQATSSCGPRTRSRVRSCAPTRWRSIP